LGIHLVFSNEKRCTGERLALGFPTFVSKLFFVLPGFGPAAEVIFFRQNDPKPLTPSLAILDHADVNHDVADQLALLRQGPKTDLSVSSFGRAEGVSKEKLGAEEF